MSDEANDILAQIHQMRAEHARAHNFSVESLSEELRKSAARLEKEGWQIHKPEQSEVPATVHKDAPKLEGEPPLVPFEEDEIMAEIRKYREEHARSQNYDVHALFEEMRAAEIRLKAEGWVFVEPPKREVDALLREDPPGLKSAPFPPNPDTAPAKST